MRLYDVLIYCEVHCSIIANPSPRLPSLSMLLLCMLQEYEKYASSGWGTETKVEEDVETEVENEEVVEGGAVPAYSMDGQNQDPWYKPTL